MKKNAYFPCTHAFVPALHKELPELSVLLGRQSALSTCACALHCDSSSTPHISWCNTAAAIALCILYVLWDVQAEFGTQQSSEEQEHPPYFINSNLNLMDRDVDGQACTFLCIVTALCSTL